MYGYAGKIARVNLTTGKTWTEDLNPEFLKDYVGGRGLAARILYDELKAGIDPLGPENKFMIATGPFAGSNIPGGTRYITACKSPLTGGWGEANAAGRMGPMLKQAGFDAIVVEGASDKPVYIYLNEGEIEIKDASAFWGLHIADAREGILKETNEKGEAALIGPAGENLVSYACVISENNRAAGRTGTGAVMGSKKLKAIAAYGTKKIDIFDKEKLTALRKEMIEMIKESPSCQGFGKNGTAGSINPHNSLGMYPAYNFRIGQSKQEDIDKVKGETMSDSILIKRETCAGCPVGCRRVVKVDEPYEVDPRYGGPEFETLGSLGTCVGLYNLEAIAKANELSNKYGLDTINVGLVISWAMECFEMGILTLEDTEGLDLTWGNAETIFTLIEKISKKDGPFATLLGEGLKVASEKIGQGSEDFAMQVKNQAFPVHMPRGKIGQGLSFATSNRGACHTQGMHDTSLEAGKTAPEIGFTDKYKGLSRMSKQYKGEIEAKAHTLRAIQDSLIICRFTCWDYGPTPPGMVIEMLNAVTGWEMTPEESMEIGDRVFTLCRMFNVREGMSRKDDTLPKRLSESLPEGATAGSVITKEDLDKMLDEYYAFRNWDSNGIPTEEKLKALGLA
jgi:aldehyde:ferredoxin oxidoreductase